MPRKLPELTFKMTSRAGSDRSWTEEYACNECSIFVRVHGGQEFGTTFSHYYLSDPDGPTYETLRKAYVAFKIKEKENAAES